MTGIMCSGDMETPPSFNMNRMTDHRDWKHYISAILLAAVKDEKKRHCFNEYMMGRALSFQIRVFWYHVTQMSILSINLLGNRNFKHQQTSMHSSSTRTARLLTVWGGGLPNPWEGADPTPPVNRMTHRCENITLTQTSFAGGNKA